MESIQKKFKSKKLNYQYYGVYMAIDYEVFEGKSLSDVFKDIYDNTEKNRQQLDVLTRELVSFIKDGDSAVQIVPMLKEYLEINVKNDDQLVKIAAIVQRLVASESKGGSEESYGLSDSEKEQLMKAVEETAEDVQKYSDNITEDFKSPEN
tara:strand:- start:72 stop:524 length:453 start_codon:yes stop_codon:yes gene_type:complete